MSDPTSPPRRPRDYERDLGVIEAFTVICEQCPSGAVRAVAEAALAAAKGASVKPKDASVERAEGDASVLREQAWLVLMAMKGWRGERAVQVHRSLTKFLGPADGGSGRAPTR
jgi:hypothetical protein